MIESECYCMMFFRGLLCLCAFVTGSGVFSLRAEEKVTVRPEVRKLLLEDYWELNPEYPVPLGGSEVGGAATPPAFHHDAMKALKDPDAEETEWMEMSRHPNLCVRLVGLAGLSGTGSPLAVARLKECLGSPDCQVGLPGGCLTGDIRESFAAWYFLTDTDYLCCPRKKPLLSKKESLSLALEVLYRDDCASLRESEYNPGDSSPPVRLLLSEITAGRLVPGMAALPDNGTGLEAQSVG